MRCLGNAIHMPRSAARATCVWAAIYKGQPAAGRLAQAPRRGAPQHSARLVAAFRTTFENALLMDDLDSTRHRA